MAGRIREIKSSQADFKEKSPVYELPRDKFETVQIENTNGSEAIDMPGRESGSYKLEKKTGTRSRCADDGGKVSSREKSQRQKIR